MIFTRDDNAAMFDIMLKASFFFLMIVLAYALKKAGVLKSSDAEALGRIVMNITLPAAIVTSFRTYVFDSSTLMIPLFSLLLTMMMWVLGFLISRKREREDKVYYMLSLPAYNIGNFTLPFVSGFLGPTGVVATCLFDMGNSFMCVGGNSVFTQMVLDGKRGAKATCLSFLKVFTKPSFVAYLVMLFFSFAGFTIPSFLYDFASSLAPANGILSMFLIGLMFEFVFSRKDMKRVALVTVLRLALAIAAAWLFFSFTHFSYEIRKAVAITAFAPISSAASVFCQEMDGNQELQGFASTVSIGLSLILIPTLIAVL